jgi:hypothetical protein
LAGYGKHRRQNFYLFVFWKFRIFEIPSHLFKFIVAEEDSTIPFFMPKTFEQISACKQGTSGGISALSPSLPFPHSLLFPSYLHPSHFPSPPYSPRPNV